MTVEAVQQIPVMVPWIGDEEQAAVAEVLASGWIAQGPQVRAFEQEFASSVSSIEGVAVSSCTAALELALRLCGVGRGHHVIVPSFSFIATANAVRHVSAQPVFADVDQLTGCLTADTIADALTDQTVAVIVVHQAGVPADVDAIHELVDPLGIVVIEDAACAAGSTYRGQPVGAGSLLAAWSFHPRKLLTTGEGGMLTSSSGALAAHGRRLREHGMSLSAAERHAADHPIREDYLDVGFNMRMTDLQAAIGRVQLMRIPEIVRRRREVRDWYAEELDGLPVQLVGDPEYGTTNVQSLWLRLLPRVTAEVPSLMAALAERGISARFGIMAAHLQAAYAGVAHVPLPVTEELTNRSLILPVHHRLERADVTRVVSVIREAVRG